MGTRARSLAVVPLLAGVLLAGCAQPADVGAPAATTDPDTTTESPTTEPSTTDPTTAAPSSGAPTSEASVADTELTITIQAGPDTAADSWTLSCDPAGGSFPDPAGGCDFLATVDEGVFAPVAANVACTEIYGGPQTSTISGTLRGNQIDAAFSRENGCEIARWDAMEPLLGPGGV